MEQHKWIIPRQEPGVPEPFRPPFGGPPEPEDEVLARLRPSQYIRGEFSLNELPARALVFAAAHGLYRLWLNGERPDERVLAPEVSAFDKEVTVQEYDVTRLLRPGQNAVGVILTDGWHIGRIGLTGDSCQYADKLALCLWLVLEYPDGRRETIPADTRFRSSTGALDYSDIFIGERYDARREPKGFSLPGFDDSAWSPVEEGEFPERLVPQTIPPVVKKERFTGRLITTPKGETVYDFGQVIAGVERFTFRGVPGTEMKLEHSETLDKEGNFLRNIAGRAKHQTDYYILASDSPETYEPIGTYHGFRYVKVTGEAQVLEAEAFAIRTDNQETASFSCSDERLNKL